MTDKDPREIIDDHLGCGPDVDAGHLEQSLFEHGYAIVRVGTVPFWMERGSWEGELDYSGAGYGSLPDIAYTWKQSDDGEEFRMKNYADD